MGRRWDAEGNPIEERPRRRWDAEGNPIGGEAPPQRPQQRPIGPVDLLNLTNPLTMGAAALDRLADQDSALGGAASGVREGLSLSWGDELQGAQAGLQSMLQGGQYGPAFRQERDRVRGNLETQQSTRPIATYGGQFGGALATGLLPGGMVTRGMGLPGRLGTSAGIGAGYGGAYAAGATDAEADTLAGDLMQRAPNAAQGAALGAALGAGFQGVFEAAPAALGAARRFMGLPQQGGRMGVGERAIEDLMTAARQNERLGVRSYDDLERVVAEAGRRDPQLTTAEALGRSAINRVVKYSRLPGRTAERAEQVLERNADTFDALIQRLDDTLAPRSASGAPLTLRGAGGELDAAFEQASVQGYQQAFRNRVAGDSAQRMQAIVSRHPEFYERALKEAEIIARGEGMSLAGGPADPRYWHYVKVAAGDVIRTMRREGLGATRARQYTQSLRRLVDELDQVPGYRAARQQWGSLSEAREALDAGFAFDRMRPAELSELAQRLTPFQRRYLQAGVAERVRDTLARRDNSGLVNIARDLTNRRRGELMRAAFGDKRGPLDEFLDFARLRRQMHADAVRMASSRESPTGIITGENINEFVPTGAISLRAMALRGMLENTIGKMGVKNRDALGRVLLTPAAEFNQAGRGLLSRARREAARRRYQTRLARTRGAAYVGGGSAGIVDPREREGR